MACSIYTTLQTQQTWNPKKLALQYFQVWRVNHPLFDNLIYFISLQNVLLTWILRLSLLINQTILFLVTSILNAPTATFCLWPNICFGNPGYQVIKSKSRYKHHQFVVETPVSKDLLIKLDHLQTGRGEIFKNHHLHSLKVTQHLEKWHLKQNMSSSNHPFFRCESFGFRGEQTSLPANIPTQLMVISYADPRNPKHQPQAGLT